MLRAWRLFDALLDRTEDAVAGSIKHLDADHVAEGHERRARLAVAQGFHHALLGQARGALAGVFVGDGARTDNGAGTQRTGLGRMRDQLGEVELHVHARLRRTEPLAVDVGQQRQVHCCPATQHPAHRGDEHRRQRRTRLGLQEAEALGQLARDQVAQRDIVDQADQLDGLAACSRVAAIGTSSVITTISASRSMP